MPKKRNGNRILSTQEHKHTRTNSTKPWFGKHRINMHTALVIEALPSHIYTQLLRYSITQLLSYSSSQPTEWDETTLSTNFLSVQLSRETGKDRRHQNFNHKTDLITSLTWNNTLPAQFGLVFYCSEISERKQSNQTNSKYNYCLINGRIKCYELWSTVHQGNHSVDHIKVLARGG